MTRRSHAPLSVSASIIPISSAPVQLHPEHSSLFPDHTRLVLTSHLPIRAIACLSLIPSTQQNLSLRASSHIISSLNPSWLSQEDYFFPELACMDFNEGSYYAALHSCFFGHRLPPLTESPLRAEAEPCFQWCPPHSFHSLTQGPS